MATTTEEAEGVCVKPGDSHCMHWWEGEACCRCCAPAMTDEQKREQGMEP